MLPDFSRQPFILSTCSVFCMCFRMSQRVCQVQSRLFYTIYHSSRAAFPRAGGGRHSHALIRTLGQTNFININYWYGSISADRMAALPLKPQLLSTNLSPVVLGESKDLTVKTSICHKPKLNCLNWILQLISILLVSVLKWVPLTVKNVTPIQLLLRLWSAAVFGAKCVLPIWQPGVCIGWGWGQGFVDALSFTASWELFFSRIMWRRKGHFQKSRQLSAPLLKILRYGCGEILTKLTCFYLRVPTLSFICLFDWMVHTNIISQGPPATQQTRACVDIVDNVKSGNKNSTLLRGISSMLYLKLPTSQKRISSYLYILSHFMPIETHKVCSITNH